MTTTNEPIIADAGYTAQTRPEPGVWKARCGYQGAGQPSASFRGLRLAILSAFLFWLANPPMKLWPLAWIALAPFLLSVTQAVRPRQAFWRGYVFGWLYLGAVWYWTGLTIVAHLQGSGNAFIGWTALVGLTSVLACFYGGFGLAAWVLKRQEDRRQKTEDERAEARLEASSLPFFRLLFFPSSLLLPAAWVVMEWMRTLGALSMPWAQASYSQTPFLPILQIADTTGAYGVSFLIVFVNAGIIDWWHKRKAGEEQPFRWLAAALTLAGFTALYGVGRLMLPTEGKPITVGAMQDGFPITAQPSVGQSLERFQTLTAQASQNISPPPALYVWSESAAPQDAIRGLETREGLQNLARQYGAAICVGSQLEDRQNNSRANASVLFDPNARRPLHYEKQQLVPFGEFIPFRDVLPAILDDTFNFPHNDVKPGDHATLLPFASAQAGTVNVGPFICYEAMYPPYARAMTRAGANLLVTQSNDAWFQSRAAMEQHVQAVVLRAIENRRDVVRATTTGITCLLDANGRTILRAPIDGPAFAVGTVHLREGRTLYVRFGDWFVALCGIPVVLLLGEAIYTGTRRRIALRRERRELRKRTQIAVP